MEEKHSTLITINCVSGGPRGEMTRDRYAGTETGDTQVGGWYRAEARRAVLANRAGDGISLGVKYDGGRGGKGETVKYLHKNKRQSLGSE